MCCAMRALVSDCLIWCIYEFEELNKNNRISGPIYKLCIMYCPHYLDSPLMPLSVMIAFSLRKAGPSPCPGCNIGILLSQLPCSSIVLKSLPNGFSYKSSSKTYQGFCTFRIERQPFELEPNQADKLAMTQWPPLNSLQPSFGSMETSKNI